MCYTTKTGGEINEILIFGSFHDSTIIQIEKRRDAPLIRDTFHLKLWLKGTGGNRVGESGKTLMDRSGNLTQKIPVGV